MEHRVVDEESRVHRQIVRVNEVQNVAEDTSLWNTGGDGTHPRVRPIDAYPACSVDEMHYERWYRCIG